MGSGLHGICKKLMLVDSMAAMVFGVAMAAQAQTPMSKLQNRFCR